MITGQEEGSAEVRQYLREVPPKPAVASDDTAVRLSRAKAMNVLANMLSGS